MNGRRFLLLALSILAAACSTGDGGATPSPGPAGSGAPVASAGAGPIGAWTVTMTEADFRAAGFSDAGVIDENTGTFNFSVTEDGTWTMAQVTDRPIRWPIFRGSWTVPAPGSIEMRTEFPQDYAGEVVIVSWTIEADGLRLEVVSPPDPLIKAQFETHPWAPVP